MAPALSWCCGVQEAVVPPPRHGLFPSPLKGGVVLSLSFGLCSLLPWGCRGNVWTEPQMFTQEGLGTAETLISEVDTVTLVMNLHCLSILIKRVIFLLCSQHFPFSSSLGAFFLNVSLRCLKASCLQNKHPKGAVSWSEHWHFILKCPPAAKKTTEYFWREISFLGLCPWKNFRCRQIVIPSYILPDKETAPINAAVNSYLFIF